MDLGVIGIAAVALLMAFWVIRQAPRRSPVVWDPAEEKEESMETPELPRVDDAPELPEEILWLADAPMFIDEEQVEAFYDATLRPDYEEASLNLSTS